MHLNHRVEEAAVRTARIVKARQAGYDVVGSDVRSGCGAGHPLLLGGGSSHGDRSGVGCSDRTCRLTAEIGVELWWRRKQRENWFILANAAFRLQLHLLHRLVWRWRRRQRWRRRLLRVLVWLQL
jgi:hypothetical protein